MTTRPMAFDIVTPAAGGQPHLRIRAAGNRTIVLASQTYDDPRSAANVVHLVIEAIQTGAFVIRYITETADTAADEASDGQLDFKATDA